MPDALDSTIPDAELRAFARRVGDARAASVIVEVRVPAVRLLRPSPPDGGLARRPLSVADGAGRQVSAQRNLQAVLGRLAELGLRDGVRVLPGAHAVVVDATAEQLRALAGMAEVAVIRPNATRSIASCGA